MQSGMANISTGIVISISLLVFHLGCVVHVDVFAHPEEVDDNGDGESCLGGRDGDAEKREHPSVIGAGEQITVEYDKVNIDSVEHQFERNEHRYHVAAGKEAVNPAAEHHQGGDQIPYKCYIHNRIGGLTFAGDHYATYYTCEEQHADCLKGEQILTVARAEHGGADLVHGRVGHCGGRCKHVGATRAQGPSARTGRCERAEDAEQTLVWLELGTVVAGTGGEEYREYKQHHYTSGIDGYLHAAQKFIVELEVKRGCGKEGEEQIGGSAKDLTRGDSKYRKDDNRHSDYPVTNCTSYWFHIL